MEGPSRVFSRNNIRTLRVRKGETYMLEKICVDMTGWCNGRRRDESHADDGIYPYMVEFVDEDRNMQAFMTDDMSSAGFGNLLRTVRRKLGAVPYGGTRVEVICPADCLDGFDGPMPAVVHGCRGMFTLNDLNEKGMKVMDFKATDRGVVRRRLESVMDEGIHMWITGFSSGGVYRKCEFPNSIYDYKDEDMSHADRSAMANRPPRADDNEDYQL